jgi:hypothetical protein
MRRLRPRRVELAVAWEAWVRSQALWVEASLGVWVPPRLVAVSSCLRRGILEAGGY